MQPFLLAALSVLPLAFAADRGTWVYKCKNAEPACNNACFDMYCLGGETKFFFDPDENNKVNRVQAGCQADRQSVCSSTLFSQKFTSQQQLNDPTCDEWPMADMKQKPFDQRRPNSLRCMDRSPNSSGGIKLKNFIDGLGKNPKRKGKGPFKEGDFYAVEFDLTGADKSRTPYCLNAPNPPSCKNDGYQFHMTRLAGENGKLSFPYAYAEDNRYALSRGDPHAGNDIKECSLLWSRKKGDKGIKYSVEVFQDMDTHTDPEGSNSGIPTDKEPLVVEGLFAPLTLYPNGPGDRTNPKFKIDHVKWTNKEKVLGSGNSWCQDTSDENTRECTFPCYF